MKYVITWQERGNSTEEVQARSLAVFSRWSPDEGTTFLQFVSRIDGGGGFAVVPALVLALGFSMPTAVGTSLLVISINAATALLAADHARIDQIVVALRDQGLLS